MSVTFPSVTFIQFHSPAKGANRSYHFKNYKFSRKNVLVLELPPTSQNLYYSTETNLNTANSKTASNAFKYPYATLTVTKIDWKTTHDERKMDGNNNKQMPFLMSPLLRALTIISRKWQQHKLPRSFLKRKNQNKASSADNKGHQQSKGAFCAFSVQLVPP
ncbi:hypothetical protein TNCV_3177691 [Trichonephila clavipes]|nr:hypothetical protein TNCV_3177691 [Trichonephila clavipes]